MATYVETSILESKHIIRAPILLIVSCIYTCLVRVAGGLRVGQILCLHGLTLPWVPIRAKALSLCDWFLAVKRPRGPERSCLIT